MDGDMVGIESVRMALLREEGHRQRLNPPGASTTSSTLARIREAWAREEQAIAERKAKLLKIPCAAGTPAARR